jgi:hypothetical protein
MASGTQRAIAASTSCLPRPRLVTHSPGPVMTSDSRTREASSDPVVEPLILDLLDWVSAHDRTYEDVMEAWRTSCPRLPVWEDANDRRLIETRAGIVRVTPAGHALLAQRRRVK